MHPVARLGPPRLVSMASFCFQDNVGGMGKEGQMWLHKIEIMIFFHKTFSMSLLIWMKINLKATTKLF